MVHGNLYGSARPQGVRLPKLQRRIARAWKIRITTGLNSSHTGSTKIGAPPFVSSTHPDRETAQCVHREAHGHVAGEVVEVALSAVEAFLGRIHDPQPPSGHSAADVNSGHRAIMFTDIVGSTKMTERLGDRVATEMVRARDSIVRRCLNVSRGREVKHTGDGIMASFASTAEAIDCAVAIQREVSSTTITGMQSLFISGLGSIVVSRGGQQRPLRLYRPARSPPMLCSRA